MGVMELFLFLVMPVWLICPVTILIGPDRRWIKLVLAILLGLFWTDLALMGPSNMADYPVVTFLIGVGFFYWGCFQNYWLFRDYFGRTWPALVLPMIPLFNLILGVFLSI